ncbi:MAG TPA: 4Fe-4S dicluster domain-containing protein [Anaerovoracaceae bacterium]|nr:4Fe-4S dicluster domain-containing protein [Anaerovoracaceae bacterium]
MKDLSVMLGKVRLKNPIVSAAGPVAGTTENIKKCADAGFGAVITKTTSNFKEFQRFPRPRYYLFDQRVTAREPHGPRPQEYSWMHLDRNSQYPPDKFVEFIKESADYCAERDCLLIGSFAGAGLDQWEEMAVSYAEAGAKALELNFCCPYPQTMPEASRGEEHRIGSTFGENPELGIPVIKRIKEKVNIPIYPKMPPTTRKQISEIAKKYKDAGADGVSFYANAMALKIDIETAEPLGFGVAIGGSHGHMMDSLADVAKVSKEVPGLPILAGRGARYWSDIIEFLMGGAATVGFSIAVMVNGLGYVQEMLYDVERWLERKGYHSLSEVQGLALPRIYKPAEIRDKVKPLYAKVAGKVCVACGRCEDVCWFGAAKLYAQKGKGAAKIEEGHCVGCTACAQVCPVNAISLHERTDEEYLRALVSYRPDLVPDIE